MARQGKEEFVRKYAELNFGTMKEAGEVLEKVAKTIQALLEDTGNILHLRDFARFEKVAVQPRTYTVKNPVTKEVKTVQKEATTRVKAKALF